MKNNVVKIFACFLTIVILLSCSGNEKKHKIGISQCTSGPWRTQMNEEIRREALLYSDVECEFLASADSSKQQIADIEKLISDGAEVLIISPNNTTDLIPIIERTYNSGIPVILVDRKVNSDKFTTFIGADNKEIGRLAADYIINNRKGSGRIVEFMGDTGITPVQERHKGFAARLKEAGVSFESFACGWGQDSARRLYDSLDATGNAPDIVFCHNDNMTQGLQDMVSERGTMVIGVDGLACEGATFVINNELTASVAYPTCGHTAMRTAVDIVHGKMPERINIEACYIVDKRNAETIVKLDNRAHELSDYIDKMAQLQDEYLMRYNMQQLYLITSFVFILILCIMLFIVFRAYNTNKRLRKEMETISNARISFFTNVSHDFRTPLTLIADPLRQLRSTMPQDSYSARLLNIAEKNVTVLLRLINQVLDFRKYEEGKTPMQLTEFDICKKMREWTDIFTPIAESRGINFTINGVSTSEEASAPIMIVADEEKIERLTYNILSNAFKYTSDKGNIRITVESDGDSAVKLAFSDDGKGMSGSEITNIFQNFYQANVHYSGTGIGLALVKAFVDMHHGKIDVESKPDHGTTFFITLPLRQKGDIAKSAERSQVLDNLQRGALIAAGAGEVEVATENRSDSQPNILIIDDEAQVRSYIRMQLQSSYSVVEASTGEEGLAIAKESIPDIIICDVMMPGIGGIETVRQLKSDICTSHIPVVMLTASTSDETQIDSYQCGADAFMPKPFNSEVLLARISNLIAANAQRQAHLAEGSDIIAKESEPALTAIDEKFVGDLHTYLRRHMADSNLRTENLCEEFHLSYTQLYRKTKQLVGKGPNELLRQIRLDRAKQLLENTDMSIADITYAVGFTSPSYFTKCFREQYDITPSELKDSISSAH